MLDFIWTSILVLFYGKLVDLQPCPVVINEAPVVFSSSDKLDVLTARAALYFETEDLERLPRSELIGPNYHNIAKDLSLDSLHAYLVNGTTELCQLHFSGFAVSQKSSEAIFRCNDQELKKGQFSGIKVTAARDIHIIKAKWANYGK